MKKHISLEAAVMVITIVIGTAITIVVSNRMAGIRGFRAVGGEIMAVPMLLEFEYLAFEIVPGIIDILRSSGDDEEDDAEEW